jgi:hypothetical protein
MFRIQKNSRQDFSVSGYQQFNFAGRSSLSLSFWDLVSEPRWHGASTMEEIADARNDLVMRPSLLTILNERSSASMEAIRTERVRANIVSLQG